jgi:predicted  nucleic acid-binding Zn-ribbon protein
LKTLLELQGLDLRIHACQKREQEIPKQKSKFDTRRQRLQEELSAGEERIKHLQVEQGNLQTEIDRNLEQARKWEGQLASVKKNEEYQALLHEIAAVKRKNDDIEERVIALEYEIEEAKGKLADDKKRVADEVATIEEECKAIDKELEEAKAERTHLVEERKNLQASCDPPMLGKYERILKRHAGTRVIVPLINGVCTGCHMAARAQVVNEILEGKVHACAHCGRLLYDEDAIAAAK